MALRDLYDVVGVERSADAKAIRRAYRARAKRAHPDGGGSEKQFEELTRAVNLLTDERRRKVYDETGREEEAEIDNELSAALQSAIGEVNKVINAAVQHGMAIETVDLIGDARKGLIQQVVQIKARQQQLEEASANIKKIAKRFRAKKGKIDRIGPMILAQARDVDQQLSVSSRDKKRIERAIEILNEHEFTTESNAPNMVLGGPFAFVNF